MNWQDSLNAAVGVNYEGVSGWRLPNIKELHTIIEPKCKAPIINETVFPNTPKEYFFSSTWNQLAVFFWTGITQQPPFGRGYVRLVRDFK